MARLSIVTLSALLALGACSLPRTGDEATEAPPASTAPSAPAEDPGPGGPDDPSELEPLAEAACSTQEQDAIDAIIAGQLDAFAAGDYDLALTFASEGFQAGLDAEAFERVITDGFPVVARDASHRTRRCVTLEGDAGTAGQALVTVTAADGESTDLVYLLLVEDGGWVISGATPVVPAADPTETVVA